MAHLEQQVSALEKALREEAKTNWDGYQEVGDLTCQYAAECLDKAADMVRERDRRLWQYTEKLESQERYKFIGMGLRDILEGDIEIKDVSP